MDLNILRRDTGFVAEHYPPYANIVRGLASEIGDAVLFLFVIGMRQHRVIAAATSPACD